ncbi:hypothetical protein A2768_00025 [Candidatus Roizmanbacteria bacterium RIFCSPHIGHO2_01_FULL_37_16]|nr:MAG: hypothetical protein A2768_00025 [Candidatus Roizmanbacteria bacterium RIFCSPHIGHO2_01_FULL_37_16]
MKNTSIAIIGASGFIGSSLFNFLNKQNSLSQIFGTYYLNKKNNKLTKLDAYSENNLKSFMIDKLPAFIIFASGLKNVDICEKKPRLALLNNVLPIILLTKLITRLKLNTKLLFISSDYVFSGNRGKYRENDLRNPTTFYGYTKKLAEEILENSQVDFKILRTSSVVGKKSKFVQWFLTQTKINSFSLYSNVYSSPTPIQLLNEGIFYLIQNYENISGDRLHLCGNYRMSRYKLGLKLLEVFKKKVKIRPDKVVNFNKILTPKDLSMMPSLFMNKVQKFTWEKYLALSLS